MIFLCRPTLANWHCLQEYNNEAANNFSHFVALDDDATYSDAMQWAGAQSCTNGEGFMYFKNLCRNTITISVKVRSRSRYWKATTGAPPGTQLDALRVA